MNRATATHAAHHYDGLSKQLAASLSRTVPGSLDHIARSRDDYAQEFRLASIFVADVFQKKIGFSLSGETRYVRKSLWNLFRKWRRTYVSYSNQRVSVSSDCVDDSYNPEGKFAATHALGVLQRKLPERDWALLRRVGESGTRCSAFDPSIDGSLATYKRRVSSARKQARAVLGGFYECTV